MNNTMLNISPSPHLHGGDSIEKNMYAVIIAMIPASLIGVFYFGYYAIILSATSIISCVFFEWFFAKYLLKEKQITITDGSAVLTGVLLAFNLPPNLPLWIVVIGALVSIGIGKMSFGGLGKNLFNPAIVGRVFLLISFPTQMTSWPVPGGNFQPSVDGETGATLLALIKDGAVALSLQTDTLLQLSIGKTGGSFGEVGAFALLLGFVFLLIRKVITWHIPVSILASVFVFTGILFLVDPDQYANPVFHLVSGGLLLGAIFMATDYVTSPMSNMGMLIYGVGIGVITVVIRVFGAYPEGISFAILIMNACTPLINRYVKPKRFGEKLSK